MEVSSCSTVFIGFPRYTDSVEGLRLWCFRASEFGVLGLRYRLYIGILEFLVAENYCLRVVAKAPLIAQPARGRQECPAAECTAGHRLVRFFACVGSRVRGVPAVPPLAPVARSTADPKMLSLKELGNIETLITTSTIRGIAKHTVTPEP